MEHPEQRVGQGDAGLARPPVILHLMHNWGGGLEHWVKGYIDADRRAHHLVLKSAGSWRWAGESLLLYRHADHAGPIRTWRLEQPVRVTDAHNPAYAAVLREIIDSYRVDYLFVSSLIGHALDLLRQPLPTCMVLHDYHPFCPALNITFGEVCRSCDRQRLERCFRHNENNRFFLNLDTDGWLALRTAFARTLLRQRPTLVAPSPSLPRNLSRLEPALAGLEVHCIAHGIEPLPKLRRHAESQRLKILIPGSLALNKGQRIFRQAMASLCGMADVVLLGCGVQAARVFRRSPGLELVPTYAHADLAALVQRIDPDLAILMATVPESFGYTLSEMFSLGLPVVASRIGSYEDRIRPGETGLLVEPDAGQLLDAVARLDRDRELLGRMRANLLEWREPTPGEMVRSYHALLSIPDWDRDLPLPVEARSCAPEVPKPLNRIERLRQRLIALHLSLHAGIIGSRWLPRRVRWFLLAAYEVVAKAPHLVLRSMFALLQRLRSRR